MSTPTRVLLVAAAVLAIATIGVTMHIANRNRERAAASAEGTDSANDARDRPDASHFWHPPPRPVAQPRFEDPNESNARASADDASTVAVPSEVANGSASAVVPSANNVALPRTPSIITDAGAHPGLDLEGNTDLTTEEWRTLGERGELRFRLPARSDANGLVDDTRARALNLRSESIGPANEVLRRGDAQLQLDVRAYYREAGGTRDPAGMPFDSVLDDIASRTPSDVVARVNGELARERGGLTPWLATTPEMTAYERMLRELIAYEVMIEMQLAEIVGPANARALVWGDNAIGASAYTYRGTAQ